ncbi:hypothetical protein COCNU_scaffold011959G000030 [Cocos nucifera]|nr:hypothetical protein [Cocos nucifera]
MATAQQQGGGGAKRKPVFTKVDQLKPGTSGHTLTAKVLSSKTVLQKGRAASAQLRPTRIAECVVGDETGTIIFTARNDQELEILILMQIGYSAEFGYMFVHHLIKLEVCGSSDEARFHDILGYLIKFADGFYLLTVDLMEPGTTVILRNAKIDMFKNKMRLAVDKWGRIEVTESANFTVKEDNNLSLVEYELVNVVEE